MRIKYLLLFGILLSITAAVYTATTTTTTTKKPTAKSTITKSAKTRAESALKTTTTNANTKNARNAKSLKIAPGEKRGKRTLYDFGNPGYIYSDIASRRAGYVSDNDAQQNNYNNYPQNGYFNGQNAIAQFPGQFGGYSGYPQYLEAPEPIIEIIIKDSNETLPTEPPQPIVTKKKKKEKVHVFYVNYKKDENNKLHLESPIASLNNDDTEEEEEEQIVQIPSAVTPPPTYRTTTLRTIIHPDSEKFHSNSGIHVTFGSADKKQRGHELEESDAESIQSQVIALPLTGSPNVGSHGKSEHLYANTRADFGVARAPSGNYINQSPYYHVPQQQQSNYYQSQQGQQQQQQQLPQAHSTTLFRQQPSFSAPAHTKLHAKPKPQQQQQQYQQQQRPHFLPTIPPATSSHQQQSSSSAGVFGKLLQQSNYYVNHNQQYPSYTTPRNQYYQTQTSTPRPTSAPKQSIFFPTSPTKQQELPSRQTPAPYQPVKFRPTSSTPQQSKPLKLQNTGYQTLQQQHQQYYQHKQQQQQQTQQYQPQQQQQQSQYQAQPQQQQHQYQPQQQQELPTKSQPFQFNRQPQYVQQPTFTVPSPNLPSSSSSQTNYYQKQQSQSQFHNSQLSSQKPSSNTKYQSQHNAAQPQAAAGLSTLHNYFDIKPSKETELLKSIPKFEQHITETIHHSGSQQHVQRTVYNPQTSFQTQNQVIHDVPAPNLGPTHKPQQSASNQGASGHYITASNLNSQQQPQAQPLQQQQQQPQQQHSATQSQYSNFVAAQNYASSTQSPQFESTNGQKIMIVTPMPPIHYQQYHSSQYTGANQGGRNYVQQQQHHQQQQQGSHNTNNFGIDPRQPASASIGSINNVHQDGSEYSVSTHHADVFKELERRKQQHQQQQQQQQYQQYEYSQNTQPQPTQKLYSTASSERPSPASSTSTTTPTTKTPSSGQQAPPSLLQLPDEVPDDLRQQLLSSGILNNADISVLDYDKVGDIALENLPAEHLQHFYGAGGGAQISESNKVVTAVKPNGDSVALSEKDIERVKQTNALPQKHNLDLKVVRFNSQNEKSIADKYVKSDATVVSPVDLASNQYNRYLPLKINGAQFPIPNSDELNGKKVVSVVVLAPVESTANSETATITGSTRSQRDEAAVDAKEVKFLGGDLIKTLVKKPTKENFKRWLDKEAHTEVEQQSVVLLVAKSAGSGEQEIFMYDISTGSVNKLNGELSSAFVNVAEENASSEDLEHASTLDPSFLDTMMMTSPQRR